MTCAINTLQSRTPPDPHRRRLRAEHGRHRVALVADRSLFPGLDALPDAGRQVASLEGDGFAGADEGRVDVAGHVVRASEDVADVRIGCRHTSGGGLILEFFRHCGFGGRTSGLA